ncbi:hypothetical protein GCM10009834_03690 [Streptomonospora arabica]|uniref:Uncharacterized protein n=1 Tax=Streptomonospora halophila TaxID=427369 RepID=A0ABP9G1P6_9ACTN
MSPAAAVAAAQATAAALISGPRRRRFFRGVSVSVFILQTDPGAYRPARGMAAAG